MVAREAMAHGRPVVATAVGGLLDAVEDGVTGVLVAPRDPVALREVTGRLLADSSLRERLGAASRSWALERLSWSRYADDVTSSYRDARGGRSQVL